MIMFQVFMVRVRVKHMMFGSKEKGKIVSQMSSLGRLGKNLPM